MTRAELPEKQVSQIAEILCFVIEVDFQTIQTSQAFDFFSFKVHDGGLTQKNLAGFLT